MWATAEELRRARYRPGTARNSDASWRKCDDAATSANDTSGTDGKDFVGERIPNSYLSEK